MSSYNEPDYMSDAFVRTSDAADIRPGLNSKIRKTRLTVDVKNRNDTPSQTNKSSSFRHIEKEKRDDGLQTPISAENKGFTMLAKMGFKPGTGLGKTGEGRTDPIPINLKSDRTGLGRERVLKEMAALKKAKLKKEIKNNEVSVDDFRKKIVEKANMKFCKADFLKSQKICSTLDSRQGIAVPGEKWFWHDYAEEQKGGEEIKEEEKCEDEDDHELSVQDRLELLTLYLRRTYFYCIWCAIQFDDEKDLQQDCPGPTRDDH